MTQTVPDRIEREIVIAAPVHRVWAALTEAEHVGTWFADAGAEVDLRPGGTMTLRWNEYGDFHTIIETVEPQRHFAWRWGHGESLDPRQGNTTRVEFSLSPEGDGTRLRVVESGFDSLDLPVEKRAEHAAENTRGWREEIDELQHYLQRLAQPAR